MKKLQNIMLLGIMLLCSISLSAKQYCQEVLTNGTNSIKLSCIKVSDGNYQIIIEGTGLDGLGGSFCHKNGDETHDIRTNMTISDDKTKITCDIASTTDPSLYTPLFVKMPSEVNFGEITDIEWGTCASSGETPDEPEQPTEPEEPEVTSSCSGDRGHFPTGATKRMHYEISYSNGDVLFSVTALNDKTIDFAEIQILNVGNYAMTITDGVATYTLSGRQAKEVLYFRFLYSDNEIGGNEMTSEQLSKDDANIITYVVGDCAAEGGDENEEPTPEPEPEEPTTNGPTTSAPVPTHDAAKVISIYSDAYTNPASFNPDPDWGKGSTQFTQYEAFKIGEDNILKYINLNYQGIEFTAQNCAAMEYVHVDIFCDNNLTVKFFPINHSPQQEKPTSLTVEGGKWNSFDVALSAFDMQFNTIWQFKFEAEGNPTIYVDNIYFYTTSTATDTEAPTNVTATVGTITHNSVELKLKATDACGAVNYEITYEGGSKTASGASDVELSCEIAGLEGNKEYTFSIVAKDLSGNAASAITASATTLAPLATPTTAAPAPTATAENVWSLYSDAYTSPTWFAQGWWGQSTIYSTITIEDNNTIKLEKFDYLGLEVANNAPQDLSAYTHLHFDVWTPNASDIEVTPIGNGESLKNIELTKETWNTIEIALSEFTNVDPTQIIQLKFAGGDKTETFYIDNIYYVKKSNDNATNVDNENANSLTIYPTVTSDIINISSNIAIAQVDIINLLGQVVYSSNNNETSINVSNLNAGQYIIRTTNADGITKTTKFIKK